jgi:hypothetical protein
MTDFEVLFEAINNLTISIESLKTAIMDAYRAFNNLEINKGQSFDTMRRPSIFIEMIIDTVSRNLNASNDILSESIFSLHTEAKDYMGEAQRRLIPRRMSPYGQKPMSNRCRRRLTELHSRILRRVHLLEYYLEDAARYYKIANSGLRSF